MWLQSSQELSALHQVGLQWQLLLSSSGSCNWLGIESPGGWCQTCQGFNGQHCGGCLATTATAEGICYLKEYVLLLLFGEHVSRVVTGRQTMTNYPKHLFPWNPQGVVAIRLDNTFHHHKKNPKLFFYYYFRFFYKPEAFLRLLKVLCLVCSSLQI